MSSQDSSLKTIVGTVAQVIFYNEDNGYTVMIVTPEELLLGHGLSITAVGFMPQYFPQEEVKLMGRWGSHPKYGEQFTVEQSQRVIPLTEEGMIHYLQGPNFEGVGKVTATNIVKAFGKDTVAVLNSENAVERLLTVPRIKPDLAEKIVKAWQTQRDLGEAIMLLQQQQIGMKLTMKIYDYARIQGMSVLELLRTDPYQLIREIPGISFKRADALGKIGNIPFDAPQRIAAGIEFVLQESQQSGNVFLPSDHLLANTQELLGFENPTLVEGVIHDLLQDGALKVDLVPDPSNTGQMMEAIFQRTMLYLEEYIAAWIKDRLDNGAGLLNLQGKGLTFEQLVGDLEGLEQAEGIELTALQKQAILACFTTRLAVITGGPGTGKTTITRFITQLLDTYKWQYRLASPTGRAAKRLGQATNQEAQTIHRLLGWQSDLEFYYNRSNPLPADIIIIDETSMLDIYLFHDLIEAIKPTTTLILIGDVDQLPSVGPGNILKDVILAIEANTPPKPNTATVTRLGYTFRQGKGSSIIHNAHLINQGQMPILDGNPDGDFFMFQVEDSTEAATTLVDLVAKRIPEKFNVRPEDIQVLSPMYRSALGVDALNLGLQERLNPLNRQAQVTLAGRTYRVGDKVMQTKNNYDLLVYNGDVGVIQRIDPESETMDVAMEDEVIEYEWGEVTQQLTLAYACSVHRSQGSEYPVVVMVVSTQHYLMLQRNLVYTAVTRAKKALIIVGTRRALHIAVKNNQVATRWSSLPWRIATAQFADYRK